MQRTSSIFSLSMIAVLVLLAVTAAQAATPEQACKSGKNKPTGKYAACRENAEAKLATGGDPSKYTDALDNCESKFSTAWDMLEAKAHGGQRIVPRRRRGDQRPDQCVHRNRVHGAEPVKTRVVESGKIVTAAGVSAAHARKTAA